MNSRKPFDHIDFYIIALYDKALAWHVPRRDIPQAIEVLIEEGILLPEEVENVDVYQAVRGYPFRAKVAVRVVEEL